jgi:hypothetical protein
VVARALQVAGSIAVAFSVASCGGGGAEGGCAAGESCGSGDPTGFWVVQDKCEYYPSQPSQPINYTQYMAMVRDPVLPPLQPAATTNGDWCSGLNYTPGGVMEVDLWHPAVPLSSGTMSFTSPTDATNPSAYETDLIFSVQNVTTHFPIACLQAGGVSSSCTDFADALTKFLATAEPSQGITALRCAASSSDSGCDCSYTFQVEVVDTGTWTLGGGILYQNSESYKFNGTSVSEFQPQAPTASTYCKGSTLTLTGNDGSSLAGVLGLRSLTMRPGQAPPDAGL